MGCVICYGNDVCLREEKKRDISKKVISTIKEELPEEALCMSAICDILSETKEMIGTLQIKL